MLSIAEACIVYADKLTYGAVCAVLGAADFHETANLLRAMLAGESGEALRITENILKEGKAVGVLLKDVIELLSRVTVCMLCKDAEKLLSLPRELYETVRALADGAEREAVLRATEILVRLESELRVSSSPRISFETAVLRVACPADDLDLSALRTRLDKLERELEALKTAAPATAPSPATEIRPAQEEIRPAQEEIRPATEEFPEEEEPVFAEAYFSDGPVMPPEAPAEEPVPKRESAPASKKEPAAEPAPASKKEPAAEPAPVPKREPAAEAAGKMTAEQAYGLFMRNVRRQLKNGVLFTMCSELAASFEGETLVLETESQSVCNALNRTENRKLMESVFTPMGIADFVVRLRSAAVKNDPIQTLRDNFPGYPIEIK